MRGGGVGEYIYAYREDSWLIPPDSVALPLR